MFAVTQVTRKVTKIRDKTMNTHRLGLLWTDRGGKSSSTVRRKSGYTNSRLTATEEVTKKLSETIESQKEEIHRAHQGDERREQDQQLLHEQLLKQNWDLREAHEKSLTVMEEVSEFHLRHYCKTKISRRSRYYSGTYW